MKTNLIHPKIIGRGCVGRQLEWEYLYQWFDPPAGVVGNELFILLKVTIMATVCLLKISLLFEI